MLARTARSALVASRSSLVVVASRSVSPRAVTPAPRARARRSGSGSKTSSDATKVYTEQDTDITVANGHTFVVALPVTSGTGYEWDGGDGSRPPADDDRAGAAARTAPARTATQQITFRAQATGSGTQHTTLTLNYARPWEDGVPPAKTATFDVTITN